VWRRKGGKVAYGIIKEKEEVVVEERER